MVSALFALHVQRNPRGDVGLGANTVHRLLHLAMTAVAAFDGIGSRRQQVVIEERQRLLQVGGEQLLQGLTELSEAANPPPQTSQFCERGVGAAPTIEQTIYLVHDVPQRSQLALPAANPRERPSLGWRQLVLHEQVTMLKQVSHLLIDPAAALRSSAGRGRRRTPPAERRFGGGQFLADLGRCTQHRFGQFLDHMEFTDLMPHPAENLGNRPGIQPGTIGRDALQSQAALVQSRLELAEETFDVGMGGIVVEHLVRDPPEGSVVDDREHAERAVVQLVSCDVAREVSQYVVEVFSGYVYLRLFFPRPPPSSGWWKTGRTRGGLATDAKPPPGRASRPPPPAGRPTR